MVPIVAPLDRPRCPLIAERARRLRLLIVRRMARLGRVSGNPFRRLTLTLATLRRKPPFRPDQPVLPDLGLMPSVSSSVASLGLGLAGGGGGSPGIPALTPEPV